LNSARDLASYDSQNDETTIANHRVFDAYGRLTDETSAAVDCLFAFTGRMYDEDTGLQNNLNRWYDGAVGQWLGEDPMGFRGGDANGYRYVGNAPTKAVDPTGLDRRIVFWFGHLAIEVLDPRTGMTIYLEFNPLGFVQTPPYPFLGAVPVTPWIKSTPEQDRRLIELWETLEQMRKTGDIPNYWTYDDWWTYGNWSWNCWAPVFQFIDFPDVPFGQPKGPPEWKSRDFPPGWDTKRHACWNCHSPEVQSWWRDQCGR